MVPPLSFLSILSGEIACYFSFLRERTLENHAVGGSMEIHEKEEERRENQSRCLQIAL